MDGAGEGVGGGGAGGERGDGMWEVNVLERVYRLIFSSGGGFECRVCYVRVDGLGGC